MAVRLINERIVHAWLPGGFFVIRTSQSDDHGIASGATCVSGKKNWLWLASSTSFLRRVRLPAESALEQQLDDNFLSSLFEADSFPLSDLAIALDVGTLYSINATTTASCADENGEECDCVLEVFGVRGYAMVGAHDGKVRKSCSFAWKDEVSAVALTHTIRDGPLRNAIVPPAFSSHAMIVVSSTGSVRVTAGFSYFDVHSHLSKGSGMKEIANMSQSPVWMAMDPGKNFVVLLGRFRAGIVFFVGRDSIVHVNRFVLKGGSKVLTRYSVIIVEEEDTRMVLEEVDTGHRTRFDYEREDGTVHIDSDLDMRLTRQDEQVKDDDHSSTLRSLLQGIETLGEREELHNTDSRSIEDYISSYNAALLFVTEWKERKTSEISPGLTGNACRLSVDLVNIGRSTRLQLPNPIVGREVFLRVNFRNKTGITLGDGWMIQMVVDKASGSKREDGKAGIDTGKKTGTSCATRVMTIPVQHASAGVETAFSFPFVIDSHTPLRVSVSLAFHHPAVFAVGEDHVDIEIPLLDEFIVDILHLAKNTMNKDIKDTSHELLSMSQLMGMLNPDFVEKQRGYPTLSRFEVPFPSRDVREILGMNEFSAAFETFLGAQFTVTVSDIALRSEGQNAQRNACSVALRGVPHVLPFVRAAVLRRLLDAVSQRKINMSKIVIRDRTNIRGWQKSLTSMADECLPSLRTAETKLVEALRIYDQVENSGSIELYYDAQERDAMISALQSARSAYGSWRRMGEHYWTPKGAASVGRKQALS